MHISTYQQNLFDPLDETRSRKLLLHKKEIIKFNNEAIQNGYTIVPTLLYFKGQLCKVEIALAKGKKLYDKRETLKQKTMNREIEKELKNNY